MSDSTRFAAFLWEVLKQQSEASSMDWLGQQGEEIQKSQASMKFFLAFGKASRYFKKEPLVVSPTQVQEAESLRTGFSPESWDQLQTARTYLLLHYPSADKTAWMKSIRQLFETADMHELKSLYAALPLMPFQEHLVTRAIEGLRTNITLVFDAVALNNPFPAERLHEEAWNQMVVKAIFMQRPLFQILDVDRRANESLAHTLIDFAHERWAAGRSVMPEAWRFVAPFLNDERLGDVRKVLATKDPLQMEAALLACHQSNLPEAKALLDEYPAIKKEIESGLVTWNSIGERFREANP
jgi:hypothetical protein